MIRSRLACVKHIAYALFSLVFLVCAVEVGLRVYDVWREPTETAPGDVLVVGSRLTCTALRPLQRATRSNPDTGEPVTVATNSHGLRGEEIAVPKPPEVYRVLCLGDETTLAMEIDTGETFCAVLERTLQQVTGRDVEVVNGGMPESSPLLSYLQVKHSLLGLQPDLIVLNFDMSDIADDHRCRRQAIFGADSQPLACPHPSLVGGGEKPLPGRIMDRFEIIRWCKRQLEDFAPSATHAADREDIDTSAGKYAWLRDNPPDWSLYIQQAFSSIDQLGRLCEQAGIGFVVATYPVGWQVSPTAGAGAREALGIPEGIVHRSRKPIEELAAYLEQRRIPLCDTSPAFQRAKEPDRLFLSNAPRLSAAGHDFYARILAQYLLQSVAGLRQPDFYQDEPEIPPFRQAQPNRAVTRQ